MLHKMRCDIESLKVRNELCAELQMLGVNALVHAKCTLDDETEAYYSTGFDLTYQ